MKPTTPEVRIGAQVQALDHSAHAIITASHICKEIDHDQRETVIVAVSDVLNGVSHTAQTLKTIINVLKRSARREGITEEQASRLLDARAQLQALWKEISGFTVLIGVTMRKSPRDPLTFADYYAGRLVHFAEQIFAISDKVREASHGRPH